MKYSSYLCRKHPERSLAPTNRALNHGGKNDADMFNNQNLRIMETKEPKSWAEAMLKHVREQRRQQITSPEPEQTITIAQLIEILAIIGNYEVDVRKLAR